MRVRPLYPALSAIMFTSSAMAIDITSVQLSGTPDSEGYYTVTINGADFGTGPRVVLYDDFNNQTVGTAVSTSSPLIGQWAYSTDYAGRPTVVSNGSGNAIQVRDFSYTGLNRIAQLEALLPQRGNQIFFSYSVTVPSGRYFSGASSDMTFPDVSSWKFTWIADGDGAIQADGLFDLCVPTHTGAGSFQLAGNEGSLGYLTVRNSWSWHNKNYFSYGMLPNATSPTSANGLTYWQHTGLAGNAYTRTKTDAPAMISGASTAFDRVKFPGWFGNGDTSNFNAYYDDIYVATGPNALARVEISDAATVGASVKNVTMPVTSWSNTNIQAKIHREFIDTGLTHLRVFNSANVGDVITIPTAGATDTAPPTAPQNLSVSVGG